MSSSKRSRCHFTTEQKGRDPQAAHGRQGPGVGPVQRTRAAAIRSRTASSSAITRPSSPTRSARASQARSTRHAPSSLASWSTTTLSDFTARSATATSIRHLLRGPSNQLAFAASQADRDRVCSRACVLAPSDVGARHRPPIGQRPSIHDPRGASLRLSPPDLRQVSVTRHRVPSRSCDCRQATGMPSSRARFVLRPLRRRTRSPQSQRPGTVQMSPAPPLVEGWARPGHGAGRRRAASGERADRAV
jgi:hypothetical protein